MESQRSRENIVLMVLLFVCLFYIASKDLGLSYLKPNNIKTIVSSAFRGQFGAVMTAIGTSTPTTSATSTNNTNIKGLPPEAPTNYTDNKNGTITDNYTGLIWKKCVQGMTGSDCKLGSPSLRIWGKAVADCDEMNFAGKTDWRIPTLKELQSIVNTKEFDPAINKKFFLNTPDHPYWTETSPAEYPANKFTVIFSDGSVYYRDINNYAATRCVRGGNQ